MTLKFVAFGMPFVTLAFMGLLAYGIARYNRRPTHHVETGAYHIEASQAAWHFERTTSGR
jgi:hypothetical protein